MWGRCLSTQACGGGERDGTLSDEQSPEGVTQVASFCRWDTIPPAKHTAPVIETNAHAEAPRKCVPSPRRRFRTETFRIVFKNHTEATLSLRTLLRFRSRLESLFPLSRQPEMRLGLVAACSRLSVCPRPLTACHEASPKGNSWLLIQDPAAFQPCFLSLDTLLWSETTPPCPAPSPSPLHAVWWPPVVAVPGRPIQQDLNGGCYVGFIFLQTC